MTERDFLEWAMATLHEINVSNYDHDDVCRLNERSVEVILAIKARLAVQPGANPDPAKPPANAVAEVVAEELAIKIVLLSVNWLRDSASEKEHEDYVRANWAKEIAEAKRLILASLSPAATSGSEAGGEREAVQKLLDKALTVLGRCHTVLFNMAKENEGAIFNRWPIHHEPLRSDARNLLPLIDEVLGDD